MSKFKFPEPSLKGRFPSNVFLDLGDYPKASLLAQSIGYNHLSSVNGKYGGWEVKYRIGHQVPEFPEGRKRYNSVLGLYYEEERCRQLVLKVGETDIVDGGFEESLKNITKYYLDRKGKLDQTLRALNDPMIMLFVATPGGMLTGLGGGIAWGHLIQQNTFEGILPAVAGAVGCLAPIATWILREKYLASNIKDKDQLIVGKPAYQSLEGELRHTYEVLNQREIYKALEITGVTGAKISMPADEFLKIYKHQLPSSLKDARIRDLQLERGVYLRETTSLPEEPLPKLIEAAKWFS